MNETICGFCNKVMLENDRGYTVTAKVKEEFRSSFEETVKNMDRSKRGRNRGMIPFPLAGMTLPVIVPTLKSEAHAVGVDLMFPACSLKCAEKLKDLLKAEVSFVEEVNHEEICWVV